MRQAAGIAAGEDDIGALSPGTPGRPEPNARAAADHRDGLSGPFRFALAGNLKWLRRSWFLRWMARRRVTGPPAVLASTEADAPVPRARLIQPRSSSSVISRVSFTSRNTTVADPDLLRQLGLAVLEDGGSAPLSQPWPWTAETP